ncbi:MAG: PEP/pyruvate-binding domain-containing protein [Pseudomonadota bacterium]
MSEQWIFHDVGVEHTDVVGKKCAHLGEMRRAGILVPPGFALSLKAYEKFMEGTGALDEVEHVLKTFDADPNDVTHISRFDTISKTLRNIVESKRMPHGMAHKIAEQYKKLCEDTCTFNAAVAVRSAGVSSHPGQYETYLHISGEAAVLRNIIRVWSSTFNARSLIARARAGVSLESDPIGTAVLKMVDAKSAGVIFTLNPVNGDVSKVSIGGSWGLGEAVVSGEVTNDQWLVDKVTLEIIERGVAEKTKECVLDTQCGEITYIDIHPELQSKPCLSDVEIVALVEHAKRVEKHFGVPQDVEWAIDRTLPYPENVFIVQARPETIWSKAPKEKVDTKSMFGEYDLTFIINQQEREVAL